MQLILNQMTKQCESKIDELFPWDVADMLAEKKELLLLDIREPYEFDHAHITDSINVPRGILETAATFGYEDTVPVLASSRDKPIILICRSGKRSLWAACTLQALEFKKVYSMKTGVRGWNDYEQPMVDTKGDLLNIELLDKAFTPHITAEQLGQGWITKDWRT